MGKDGKKMAHVDTDTELQQIVEEDLDDWNEGLEDLNDDPYAEYEERYGF